MAKSSETVLYYCPENIGHRAKRKAVFVQMGVRIRNILPEHFSRSVGELAGMEGYECVLEGPAGEIDQEVLVLAGFTQQRINELLYRLSRTKQPKIDLKAIVTDTNAGWSFYQLYQEIAREHEQMKSAANTSVHSQKTE